MNISKLSFIMCVSYSAVVFASPEIEGFYEAIEVREERGRTVLGNVYGTIAISTSGTVNFHHTEMDINLNGYLNSQHGAVVVHLEDTNNETWLFSEIRIVLLMNSEQLSQAQTVEGVVTDAEVYVDNRSRPHSRMRILFRKRG